MPITAEQFAVTLENMTQAWKAIPEGQRLRKDEEQSFFDYLKSKQTEMCEGLVKRWHSGESSHPDRLQLAKEYENNPEGYEKLRQDLLHDDIKGDPFVQAADLNLRLIKYTASE